MVAELLSLSQQLYRHHEAATPGHRCRV